jgi:uncharacterized protein DUF4265
VTDTLTQVWFRAADGHREVLWADAHHGHYRVLNVPVWLYGISVGTVVGATAGERWKEFSEVITPSTGGTVRLFVPDEAPLTPASRFYLEQMLPECRERRLPIGPATFFDPLVVAVHIRDRSQWDQTYARYLDELVDRGSIRFWEVGDPDPYPPEKSDEIVTDSELVHPRPTDDRVITF